MCMELTKTIFKFHEYREFLKYILEGLKKKNSSFSLRAFAKKLEMQPSFLSEILASKKRLSLEKALQISRVIRMNPRETTFFCYLVALDHCVDLEQQQALEKELTVLASGESRDLLDLQLFEVIAQWECIALLELLTVYQKKSPLFYAQQLGLSEDQISKAFFSLEQAKLVRKDDDGYTRTEKNLLISSKSHHLALKIYHSAMLEKARHAIYNQSPISRYTGTETLMIDQALLPDAHQVLNDCFDKLLLLFKQSEQKNTLVHIQFNLFQLNQTKGKSAL